MDAQLAAAAQWPALPTLLRPPGRLLERVAALHVRLLVACLQAGEPGELLRARRLLWCALTLLLRTPESGRAGNL